MARFFFDVVSDGAAEFDDLGTVLPNAGAAEAEALRLLPDLLSENPDVRDLVCVVRDARGRSLYKASLAITCETLYSSSPAPVRPGDVSCFALDVGRSRRPSRKQDNGREPEFLGRPACR